MQALQTTQLPPFAMRAAVSPDTFDAEKRTVDVVWTTGAKVLRGYFDKFYEELSLDPKHVRMDRLNNGAPVLASHNASELAAVLGVVEPGSARLQPHQGIATVRFAKAADDPAADAVFRKVRDGIIQNVSVGYNVYKFEKTEQVENKIPTLRAIDWEPFEISFVAMGADDGAGTRGAANKPTHLCEVVSRYASMTVADADRLRRLRLAKVRFL
jgi:phage head maturation protease